MAYLRPKLHTVIRYWQQLTPLTQGLLILLIACTLMSLFSTIVAISDALIFDLPVRTREIPFSHLFRFLTMRQDLDSWEPMWSAFEQLKASPHMPLYAEVFFEQHTKFQYPLTSLLLFYGLQAILSPFHPDNPQLLYQILAIISWIFFIGLIFVSIQIFNTSLVWTKVISPPRNERILQTVLLILLGLSFYPAIRAYSLGQIQAWINALFAVMLWCWMKEKKQISGVLGGLICLIKPQYAVILLWSLLRKQWRFAIAFMVTAAAGGLIAIALFGIENNLDYLKVLSYISKHGEAYYPNQSVNGLLNRLLFNGSNLKWTSDAFAPFNIWVYLGTLASSLLLLILALRPPQSKQLRGSTFDFATIALTTTMASPIAWEHHYGILLPIYAFVLPQIFQYRIWANWTLPILGLSYLLTSNYLYVAKHFAQLPLLNLLQSYLFFGSLLILLSLYRLQNRAPNFRFD
ncbi:MAG: glycosyltransferase family 87 protein [Thainema sp.]